MNGYAQGKYILKDFDLNPIVHDDDIDEIGDTLVAAGADVSVVGDVDEGHEIFNVKNYLYGVCIADFYTVTSEALTFAAAGEFYAGYDEFGNHILKYVYNPEQTDPEEYVTTLRAVAQEDYTFWAWRCYDPTTDTTSTLYDDQPIYLSYPTSNPYVFTADYAEAADVTVGGNGSVGHAGWVMDVTFGEDVEPFHSTIGTSDYTFKFPITQNQNSNETTEPISVGYTFDGSAFSLNLESEFVSSEGGDSVEYVENRAFTPIPAEGYMFTGISVNGHDLAVGETAEIVDTTDLNVVAKYAEIPNPASTGDSTPNMWWLVGLAVLAMLGVAYGASRKQKGIRC
ncbi:MAG: hypothetical protein Q4F54_05210 [Coriobacteriia bacterium]|nr:hypothetical protein [Coriobacteriia bacterium]